MATDSFNFDRNMRSDENFSTNIGRSVNQSDSLKAWQEKNMYRTSYYSMSRYNVSLGFNLIN